MSVKKRFKDEKNIFEHDLKKSKAMVSDLQHKLEAASQNFYEYKQETEHSPLNVLRNELGNKQIQIVELETRLRKANEDRDDYAAKYQNLQQQLVALKKQRDQEKENMLQRQAEELETIKKQMRDQEAAEAERAQIQQLKNQLADLSGKLTNQPDQA